MLPDVYSDGELFPSFLEFVKSDGNNNDQQKKLEANLKKLNDFLAEKGGPFFGGDTVNALDLQIAPKLKHINIGGKATKVNPNNLYFKDCLDTYAQQEQ